MARTENYCTTVEFGDCDPAGIAFYANFFRWHDASTRHFFAVRGVPAWRDLERDSGIIGTPVVEASANYLRPLSYGDRIEVRTAVAEWKARSFVLHHAIYRRDELCAQGREVRIFATRHPHDSTRIEAADIPELVRRLCT